MIELPEAQTLAQQLKEALQGKRIQNVTANASPHGFAWFVDDPQTYHGLLSGRVVDGAQAFGGWVEIMAGEARMAFHEGVNLRLYAPGESFSPKHQLHVEFEEGDNLVCTVQMYGGLLAFQEGTYDNFYYAVAKEKPSPLTDTFDKTYFDALWDGCKPTLSVKAFLATEQRVPGLGNGVLQDILWNARLNPRRKLNTISADERDVLFQNVKQTLFAMTAAGGRDTEKDLFGCPGGYASVLSSKTLKNPCPHCQSGIVREAYLGGNVYYCPFCQEKPGKK